MNYVCICGRTNNYAVVYIDTESVSGAQQLKAYIAAEMQENMKISTKTVRVW